MDNADSPMNFDSLENSDEYPAWSLDDQIDFDEETFLEGPTTNLPNNENDNVFSPVEGTFDQSGWECPEHGFCDRLLPDGKFINCASCSSKEIDKDFYELLGRSVTHASPTFQFYMPLGSAPVELDNPSLSNDIPLPPPITGNVQTQLEPLNCEPPRHTRRKRKRIRESSPVLNMRELMKEFSELLKEVLETPGPVSPELRAKIQLSVAKEESLEHHKPITHPPRREDTDFAGPMSHTLASPIAITNQRNERQLWNQQGRADTCNSTARFVPGPTMKPPVADYIESDDNLMASAQPQPHTTASTSNSILHGSDLRPIDLAPPSLHEVQQPTSIVYPCTSKKCSDKTFSSKYDWKRHEESHKQHYMCRDCAAGLEDPKGWYACGICRDHPFPNLDAVKMHTIQCKQAQRFAKSFSRIDNLRTHLRRYHGQHTFSQDAFNGVFEIDSKWWRECGFCGMIFNNWDLRANHVAAHFANGETISTWKVPFERPIHETQKGVENKLRDDDDTDCDNDNHDNNDGDDNDTDDNYDADDGFDNPKGSNAIPDFNQRRTVANSPRFGMWSGNMLRIHGDHGQGESPRLQALHNQSNLPHMAPGQTTYMDHLCYTPPFSTLDAYRLDPQPHERFLLGMPRQPLNVTIGAARHQSASLTPFFNPQSRIIQSSLSVSTSLAASTVGTPSEVLDIGSFNLPLVSSSETEPSLNCG